ncbi:prepilin-type N-terminal cleavage/methylation domain-containing protein [Candidatus Curtissbacteria bacterium]|nr:prepilin-type N-terminal cleavage/methylation domain-containing protein [Candidatus Curtissbacteria bacterium]
MFKKKNLLNNLTIQPASQAKRGEQSNNGFTLIELLVVIAIIGILATIVVASFAGAQARGRDSRRKADLDAVKKALDMAKQDCLGSAYYPVMAGASADVRYDALEAHLDDADLAYIKVVPVDPSKTGANDYHYTTSGTTTANACLSTATPPTFAVTGAPTFLLRALLENKNDPQSAPSITQCLSAGAAAVAGETPYYVCND